MTCTFVLYHEEKTKSYLPDGQSNNIIDGFIKLVLMLLDLKKKQIKWINIETRQLTSKSMIAFLIFNPQSSM